MPSYEEQWIQGPESTYLYTRYYGAKAEPKAHLIYVHGFLEHVARYDPFVFPAWAASGISVFSWDQRGFGLTATDKEHKSPSSTYSVTSWKSQMDDLAFLIKHERKRVGPNLPIFLMGHSMGGGEVLGFAATPKHAGFDSTAQRELKGIIASSPCIRQTNPEPAWKLWAGSKAASILPKFVIPAHINAEDLSHDPAIVKGYLEDPLVRPQGSLRHLADMLGQGIALAERNYKTWPATVPVLFIHGSDDQATSSKATQKFHDDISATDKHISIYQGGFHELMNEPDGVKEKFVEEVAAWILTRAAPLGASAPPKL